MTIPTGFSVPYESPWPESTHGIPLGKYIKDVTSKTYLAANPGVEEKLQTLGKISDQGSVNDIRFQNVFDALVTYKKIYGDLAVSQPFVVPNESKDWPENTWNLRLGARVNAIRSQGTFLKGNEERRDMLNEIGFLWGNVPKENRNEERDGQNAAPATASVGGSPDGTGDDSDESDLESFVSSFDFSEDSEDDEEDEDGSFWGYDENSEMSKVVAAAREEQEETQKSEEEEYVSEKSLDDSLAVAKQRALDSGVLVER